MTYVLVGTNWHKLKVDLDRITNEFLKKYGDLALERLDGAEANYQQILGAVESLPFLASKKLVIVHNLSASKEASEALEHIIERAGDITDLVIVESKLDKRSVYYKSLKKMADFREYNELDEQGLTNWLIIQASGRSASLSSSDARFLVQRVGLNQTALDREFEKLAQYSPSITRESIELLVAEEPSSTIFNMIDRAFAGDLKSALKLYDEQRTQKVEPQAMHAMLVWQMHVVALCDLAEGKSSQEIASDAGMSPFVVQKSQAIAIRMGRAKINAFLKQLRDIDYRSKHVTLDYDEAMRFAIVSLSN